MSGVPRVAILVLNLNGREHLKACLPTLEAQVYPNRQIVVVDNGSTDGSLDYVRDAHPSTRLIPYGRNLGFCAAYNRAVASADADYVALLNNDTRVEPNWLEELVSAARRHDAAIVGSRMLDWNGRHPDFDGGITTVIGHSWQTTGAALDGDVLQERQRLFACAGSMLVSRPVFLEAGGFDEDFFAYFEDVDLGWRVSVLGYRVVFAPRAITYHRLHGTAGTAALAPRLRLYERNALAALFKNYEPHTLARVLPVAVALALYRGLAAAQLDGDTFRLGEARVPAVAGLPAPAIGFLMALEDFGSALPVLSRKRAIIQEKRRRSDAELFALFGDPFKLHDVDVGYTESARALIADFGLDSLVRPAGLQTRLYSSAAAEIRHSLLDGHGTPDRADAPLPGRGESLDPLPGRGGSLDPPDPPPGRGGSLDAPEALSGRGGSLDPPDIDVVTGLPLVSVVIPTILGAVHLPTCLDALAQQEYPADLIEIIVVDNGTVQDLTSLATRAFPRAHVITPGRNLGFAAANNLGAARAAGEFIAFLNDDTRVDRGWVSGMIDVARRRNAACVASYIVDWDGVLVDFAGGLVNFEGKGFQQHINVRVDAIDVRERPLLFANGAGMMVRASVLREVGGWDDGTFAYYEDVELGWRFWLLGHEVWLAPGAVVQHRHHGTSGRWPEPPRVRLLERNALRMIYALLERETLSGALSAALLLAADRSLLQTSLHRGVTEGTTPGPARARESLGERAKQELRLRGARRTLPLLTNLRRVGARGAVGAAMDTLVPSIRRTRTPGSRRAYMMEHGLQPRELDGRREAIPADGAARLLGLYDFLQDLPSLSNRRREIQARRQRSDAEILEQFGAHWLSPVPAADQALHNELHATLVHVLGLNVVRAHESRRV